METIWLVLILEGATTVYNNRRQVRPVMMCVYEAKEQPRFPNKRYTYYIDVTMKCPPYAKIKEGQ